MRFIDGVQAVVEMKLSDYRRFQKAGAAVDAAIDDPDYGRGYVNLERKKIIWSVGDAAERKDGSGEKIKGDFLRSLIQKAGVTGFEIEILPEGRPRRESGWVQFWPEIKPLDDNAVVGLRVNEGFAQAVMMLEVRKPWWTRPSLSDEGGEVDRTASALGIPAEQLRRSFNQGVMRPLTDERWAALENTDSWDVTLQRARDLASEYGRDLDGIITSLQRGDALPAPVVLGTDPPYLIGGNTRLMAAAVLGLRPTVLWVTPPGRLREDAATDVQGKVSREVTAAVKAGRGALDALRRVSDADLLRAADETPDAERPDPREVTGKAKERVDPSKMGSVRDEIERRFKRIAASRGTETAKRAIAQLAGALPEVEDEEVPPEILNTVAGLAAFQKEQR